jgi:amidase
MSIADDGVKLDAAAQAELVRKKEVTPLELVDAAIERIERVNPRLNAVVTTLFEQGRDQAKGRLPEGPFTGVPFLVKDLLAEVAGVKMTEGSAYLKHFVPESDTEVVLRLKRAGLIFLGKTNSSEFGLLPTAEPRLFGPSRNPWDPERTPGGSSGGSAAAVASGMVPMAEGSDGAGSIRIPASCCGVFGLKPTRARTPLGPQFIDILAGLIVAEHAITRSVRDSAALLDALSGPVPAYPYWVAPPARPFIQEVGVPPGKLRIAYCTKSFFGLPVHDDCIAAVHDAAGLCADLGHEIFEASPVIEGQLIKQFGRYWSLLPAIVIDHWKRRLGKEPVPEDFEPMTWALYEWGRKKDITYLYGATEAFQRISEKMAAFFNNFDVFLTPTLGEPPVALGTFDATPENPIQGMVRSGLFAPFTAIFNVTGQPAMSVPLFWNRDGLPIGTQFVARYGDESTLFRLAAQLETARPWVDRRPVIWAG